MGTSAFCGTQGSYQRPERMPSGPHGDLSDAKQFGKGESMTAWIDSRAICEMAPDGFVWFAGLPDWKCLHCDQPVSGHTLVETPGEA
jgi:hypothetical protein